MLIQQKTLQILEKTSQHRSNEDIEFLKKILISKIPIFDYFQTKLHTYICQTLQYLFINKGDIIYEIQQPSDKFFININGKVLIFSTHNIQSPETKELLKTDESKEFKPMSPQLASKEHYNLEQQKQIKISYNQEIQKQISYLELKYKIALYQEQIISYWQSFGELDFINNIERQQIAICVESGHFAYLERNNLINLINNEKIKASSRQQEILFLKKECQLFQNSDDKFISQILNIAVKKTYNKGDQVYSQSDQALDFYIISKGIFRLIQKLDPMEGSIMKRNFQTINNKLIQEALLLTYGPGNFFGEYELIQPLNNQGNGSIFERQFSVRCESNESELICISRHYFFFYLAHQKNQQQATYMNRILKESMDLIGSRSQLAKEQYYELQRHKFTEQQQKKQKELINKYKSLEFMQQEQNIISKEKGNKVNSQHVNSKQKSIQQKNQEFYNKIFEQFNGNQKLINSKFNHFSQFFNAGTSLINQNLAKSDRHNKSRQEFIRIKNRNKYSKSLLIEKTFKKRNLESEEQIKLGLKLQNKEISKQFPSAIKSLAFNNKKIGLMLIDKREKLTQLIGNNNLIDSYPSSQIKNLFPKIGSNFKL